MLIYIIITIVAIIVIARLYRQLHRPKRKSVYDKLMEIPEFAFQKQLYKVQQGMCQDGTDQDVIPGGYGEFGLEVTNPIPVNTTFGEILYLAKFRTLDGVKVEYKRVGSTIAPNIKHPIDIYEIYVNSKYLTKLYLSMYHKKISRLAPKGFKFI